jgi:iron complex transport system ATP-binding protein
MRLAVESLSFRYNGHNILNDIDFSVRPGEILAILGPNGVGKTTLLKCLNKIHKPFCGSILVENMPIMRMNPSAVAGAIGYVAQKSETARLTVFDAVLMGRKPHLRFAAGEEDLRIVNSALDHLKLGAKALCYLDQLSGGELQKVSIARALVQEPKLLLLDEPTSALDLKNQTEIMQLIRHIAIDHELGVVFTMHDLNTAFRYADTALLLKEGRVYSYTEVNAIRAPLIEEVYGIRVELHSVNGRTIVVPIH